MSSDVREQITRISCRIGLGPNGKSGAGTGFWVQFREGRRYYEGLVTNKHVLDGHSEAYISIELADCGGQNPKQVTLGGGREHFTVLNHPDDDVDLCIMEFRFPPGSKRSTRSRALSEEMFIDKDPRNSDVSPIENITFVGYPLGLSDEIHNRPLVRRGVTATHPLVDYNGRSVFLIDAACFPGSSGSPVFLHDLAMRVPGISGMIARDRVAFIGILSATKCLEASGRIVVVDIPTATRPISLTNVPAALGVVIRSSRLLDFKDIVFRQKTAMVILPNTYGDGYG